MADARHLRWQTTTIVLLALGYAGYYLCRANLSVALPLLGDELEAGGATPEEARLRLGLLISLGVGAYAIGKFAGGPIADLGGGKRAFVVGMLGSVAMTIAFAAGQGLPVFTLAWTANRGVQALGWVGLVKVASRWFGSARHATVMALLSLSFLWGDAAARVVLGAILAAGYDWREVFRFAALALAALAVASIVGLREKPADVGLVEPDVTEPHAMAPPAGPGAVLAPLLRSRAFLWTCALSVGLTLLRESLSTWTPTYFREALALDVAAAASWSAIFPLGGGAAVLVAGFAGDAVGRRGRARLALCAIVAAAVSLVALATAPPAGSWPIVLVAATGFLVVGPYSYLAGAMALDFGGKRGSATAAGVIDGVGYVGGMLAGGGTARLAVAYGWDGAFLALAGVAAASALAAWGLLRSLSDAGAGEGGTSLSPSAR